jgi:tetratricopeptide (TPR) repeat protein
LQLLVTSHTRLNVSVEWIYRVEGLRCPPADAADIRQWGAAELFLYHVTRLRPGLHLPPDELRAVGQLCRLVGGLPLALELAASWIRTLSIPDIASGIRDDLDLLATTRRDIPERHQNIRLVFERSWQLLSSHERTILSQLSILHHIDRDAARQVADASLVDLSSLLDKSMLKRTGPASYQMHPLLRQFGLEKLAAQPGAEGPLRRRHARYYGQFLRDREQALKGGRDSQALREIDRERDNIRLAWEWAVEQRATDVLAVSLDSLALYLEIRGSYEEAIATFGRAIAALENLSDRSQTRLLVGRLLARQGTLYYRLGDYQEARRVLDASLDIFQQVDAVAPLGHVYLVRGDLANIQGQPETAQRHYLTSMEVLHHAGDPGAMAWVKSRLGWVALKLGHYDQAWRYLQDSVVLFREMKNQRGMVWSLNYLGLLSRRQGHYRQAIHYHEQSLAISREIDYRHGIARSLYELGDDRRDLGEYELAHDHLQQSVAIFTELDSPDRGLALYRCGYINLVRGEIEQGERLLRQSHGLFASLGSRDGTAWARYYLGELAFARGAMGQAAKSFRRSLALFEEIGDRGNLRGMIRSLLGLGRVERYRQDYQRSRNELLRALEMAWDLPSLPDSLRILAEIGALLADWGRPSQAVPPLALALHHPGAQAETKALARGTLTGLAGRVPAEVLEAALEGEEPATLDQVVQLLIHSGWGDDADPS